VNRFALDSTFSSYLYKKSFRWKVFELYQNDETVYEFTYRDPHTRLRSLFFGLFCQDDWWDWDTPFDDAHYYFIELEANSMSAEQRDLLIHTAFFRFFEELNDYLPEERCKKSFPHEFIGNPSIKDTVEAIGVPHTEIDLILVDGESVGFNYKMCGGEHVSVYPVFESFDITPLVRLRSKPLRDIKFVADVNIAKLAKKLRLLGFDTLFGHDLTDKEIVELSLQEKRVILTRDKTILKYRRVTHGYWIRNDDPDQQLREVVSRFQLENNVGLLARCSICNDRLHPVDKSRLHHRLPNKTLRPSNVFWECKGCQKVYRQGPNFGDIREWMME
jgi:hypothetical protein